MFCTTEGWAHHYKEPFHITVTVAIRPIANVRIWISAVLKEQFNNLVNFFFAFLQTDK